MMTDLCPLPSSPDRLSTTEQRSIASGAEALFRVIEGRVARFAISPELRRDCEQRHPEFVRLYAESSGRFD